MKTRDNFIDPFVAKGYVHWEIENEDGKVLRRGVGTGSQWWVKLVPQFLQRFIPLGKRNAIVNLARSEIASLLQGGSITVPSFIAVGSGTNSVASADTALQTAIAYTGSSATAKAVSSRTLMNQYTCRYIATFGTTEITTSSSDVVVREAGLFTTSSVTSNMWARVNMNVTKAPTERLNVYWYITFERRSGVAIKTGESVATSGNITANTDSTLTFATAATIVAIHNDTGQKAYIKFNGGFDGEDGSTAPNNYDLVLEDGQSYFQSDEEIEVANVHVYVNASITMPHNTFVVRGW